MTILEEFMSLMTKASSFRDKSIDNYARTKNRVVSQNKIFFFCRLISI